MRMCCYVGPLDEWQAQLQKASKSGLLMLIDRLTWGTGYDRDALLRMARQARKEGRIEDMLARHDRYNADPDKAYETHLRRQLASAKAARRRKREAKKGTRA